ncbi:hypothetical protein ABBQ38_005556 [Trebouxia sp. C0009 RCD-2024]
MSLSGQPGNIKLAVRDESGPEGTSMLQPDSMDLVLKTGPSRKLAVEGPVAAECATRAVLPQLKVRVADMAGNFTNEGDFEVALNPSALAADDSGHAVSVQACGGNKIKLQKGTAVFKDVKITAEEAGEYVLRIASGSRKVALEEAELKLTLSAANFITDVAIDPDSLPDEPLPAGSSFPITVKIQTEDGQPLPLETAAESLTLKLTPPSGHRADILTLQPSAVVEASDLANAGTAWCAFAFDSGDLTCSGAYTVTAEHTEQRPELARALLKKELSMRSPAISFEVSSGPLSELQLAAESASERVTVTNGEAHEQRVLLSDAVLQVADSHGNAVLSPGIRVCASLQWPEGSEGAADGGILPELQSSEGKLEGETDRHGRVCFGALSVKQGSGKAAASENQAANSQGNAMACVLVVQVQVAEDQYEGDAAPEWRCEVLFCDDSSRFESLNQLTERHTELAARRQQLQAHLEAANRELANAQQEAARAQKAAEAKARDAGPSAPANLHEAQARLAEVRQGAEAGPSSEAGPPAVPPRFGPPNQATTHAIQTCLHAEDPEVVGVLAQLATVDDTSLSQVLAATYRALLPVLVVQSSACTQRLNQLLAQAQQPVPDILSLSHSQPYKGPTKGQTPGMAGCGDRAAALLAAACKDSDALLPVPLPHTRALRQKQHRGGHSLGPNDWPGGCLGYAFNLVRPTRPGHRGSLLYSLLGTVLVFETLQDASAYRELVTQKLESNMADLVCLDGKRITSKGITSGSNSFRVTPLAEAPCCFGSSAQADTVGADALRHQEATLDALVEALQNKQEAEGMLDQAQQAAEEAASVSGVELQQVAEQLAALDAELTKQGGVSAQRGRQQKGRSQAQPAEGRKGGERHAKRASLGEQQQDAAANECEEDDQPAQPVEKTGKRRRLARMQA